MKFRFVPVVLTAALTSLGTLFLAARLTHTPVPYIAEGRPAAATPVNYASYANAAGSIDFTPAAEGSVKAVVHIKTATKARTVAMQQDPFFDEFFGNMFGQRQGYIPPQRGSGSGVVISPDGYIVTNNHVVAGAEELTVTFNDRYTAKATVVGTDPSTDIAVVKVEKQKNLPFMEFGNSDDVKLGQWVLAVGYPLSLDATVTAGIVSAKSRAIGINRQQSRNSVESFIQTDAAVNPGNSGGALVNTAGQLIGINSAIASPTGSYAGYSYAIPANIVRKVVNDLMQFGAVKRGMLGVGTVSDEKLGELGLIRNQGVYVGQVVPGSGAATAGIQVGDFITQINGVVVNSFPAMQEQVTRYQPGDNVSITYVRNGSVRMTSVRLGETKSVVMQTLGATLRPVTAAEKKTYGIIGGLVVEDIGTGELDRKTNMRKGFIILSVNDQPVSTLEELNNVLNSSTRLRIAGINPGYKGMYYYGLNGAGDEQGQ